MRPRGLWGPRGVGKYTVLSGCAPGGGGGQRVIVRRDKRKQEGPRQSSYTRSHTQREPMKGGSRQLPGPVPHPDRCLSERERFRTRPLATE